MIYFTADEIGRSLLIALAYGVFFCLIISLFDVIYGTIKDLFYSLKQIIVYEKITSEVNFVELKIKKEGSAAGVFVSVVLFFIGYILISYMTLDGCVRIYMLIVSSASLFLLKLIICDKFVFLMRKILRSVICGFVIALRTLLYPLCRFYQKIRSKIVKNLGKIKK